MESETDAQTARLPVGNHLDSESDTLPEIGNLGRPDTISKLKPRPHACNDFREISADDPFSSAEADWRRKHRIADVDPMIAALDLVRIYLRHSREIDDDPNASPPSFEDFRGTIQPLDRRSKSFVQQVADIVSEMRRFAQSIERLDRSRFLTQLLLVAQSVAAGILIGRLI